VLLIPGLHKDLAGTRTEHESCSFLTLTGMATHSLVYIVTELEISNHVPLSIPNPSRDHEADGPLLAKAGPETVSIITRVMIDLNTLPESTVVLPCTYRLQ
jgi:hypothetical protein